MTPLAISMGCPGGIGPEVTLGALAFALRTQPKPAIIFGDLALLRARAALVGLHPELLVALPSTHAHADLADHLIGVISSGNLDSEDRMAGKFTKRGGAAQLGWVNAACDAVVDGSCSALVTGPVCKEAVVASGIPESDHFMGHTEHLGRRLGGVEPVMAFVADKLIITLATTHISLSQVANQLSQDDVTRACVWTCRLVHEMQIDVTRPVAVLALNPHAGEGGLLGDEESRILKPAIDQARSILAAEGSKRVLCGPLPAETAIRKAVHTQTYAACVAMYHDQATIPAKLVAFGDAVNVTLGLPIVRTSVDHGTGYDIAGTGKADVAGMVAALALANRLVGRQSLR